MSNPSEPMRQFLAAISETLTLPGPASDLTDLVKYESCVTERTHLIQMAIRDILADDDNGLDWEAAYLRKKATDRPPRYRTTEQWLDDLREVAAGGETQ